MRNFMGQKFGLISIFIFVFRLASYSQDKSTYDLVNAIQKDVGPYYLTDSAFQTPFQDITARRMLIEESIKFITKSKLLNMLNTTTKTFIWDQNKLTNSSCIKNNHNLNRDTNLISGRPVYHISVPIFDPTKKFAIIYIGNSYVMQQGGSSCTYFYHFNKDKWEILATGKCLDF
jgi:hypothetical protein